MDAYIDRYRYFQYTDSGMLRFLYGPKCWCFASECFLKEGDTQESWVLTDGH